MSQWDAQGQSFQQYCREVESLPQLSEEEALALVQQVRAARSQEDRSQEDREARSALLEGSLSLVLSIAPHYVSRRVELLDLVQEGNLALLNAIDTCTDIKQSFTAYASNVIRHAICAAMDGALPIRVPRSTLQKARKQNAADGYYEMQPLSLDMPLRDQPGRCFGDTLEAITAASLSPEEAEEQRHQVAQLLDTLPEQERRALQLRFGLDENDQHEHSFEEIAAKLRIHERTARAVITRGILMLKGQRETPQQRESRQAKAREARLENAYAELQQQQAPITEESLAQAAHVHNSAAAEFLRTHDHIHAPQQMQQRACRLQTNEQARRERLDAAYARLMQQEEAISADLLAEVAQVKKNVACAYLREVGYGKSIAGMTPKTYLKLMQAYQQLQPHPSASMSVQRLAQAAGVKWQAAFRFLSVQRQAQSQEEKVAV
jgi:RNA polymerase primary sigma factor